MEVRDFEACAVVAVGGGCASVAGGCAGGAASDHRLKIPIVFHLERDKVSESVPCVCQLSLFEDKERKRQTKEGADFLLVRERGERDDKGVMSRRGII